MLQHRRWCGGVTSVRLVKIDRQYANGLPGPAAQLTTARQGTAKLHAASSLAADYGLIFSAPSPIAARQGHHQPVTSWLPHPRQDPGCMTSTIPRWSRAAAPTRADTTVQSSYRGLPFRPNSRLSQFFGAYRVGSESLLAGDASPALSKKSCKFSLLTACSCSDAEVSDYRGGESGRPIGLVRNLKEGLHFPRRAVTHTPRPPQLAYIIRGLRSIIGAY